MGNILKAARWTTALIWISKGRIKTILTITTDDRHGLSVRMNAIAQLDGAAMDKNAECILALWELFIEVSHSLVRMK